MPSWPTVKSEELAKEGLSSTASPAASSTGVFAVKVALVWQSPQLLQSPDRASRPQPSPQLSRQSQSLRVTTPLQVLQLLQPVLKVAMPSQQPLQSLQQSQPSQESQQPQSLQLLQPSQHPQVLQSLQELQQSQVLRLSQALQVAKVLPSSMHFLQLQLLHGAQGPQGPT